MSDDLHRALADLADAAASSRTWDGDAVDTRVRHLVTRVRRRRATVAATASAAALGTVGALAVAAAALSGHLGEVQPAGPTPLQSGPAPSTTSSPQPDATAGPPLEPTGPAADLFACGLPAPESVHTLPDAGHLTAAPDLDGGTWDPAAPPALSVTVGATGGYAVTADVGRGWLALVGPDGTVAGFLVPEDRGTSSVTLRPDETRELTTATRAAACDPEQPLTGAYVAWPFVEATGIVATLDGTTDEQPAAVVVANPQQVTFAG